MSSPANAPVGFKELLQVTELGIAAENIKFKNVTLQSEKYVVIREEGTNSLAIVDTSSKNVLRLPIAVDSAIMNPVSKVIALRNKESLQIYNLEMKSKMKAVTISEPVAFWKWLDPKTVAIVTDVAVYHWSMDGTAQPEKKFARSASEGPVQIINYQPSADGQWLILGGISAANGAIKGVLQVFSVQMNASQPTMDAHTACFAAVKIDGQTTTSNLFCFTKKSGDETKLNILQLGVAKANAFTASAAINIAADDFAVSMVADNKFDILYIITKKGLLFVYEIQSATCIFQQQAARSTMFTSVAHSNTGMVAVDQSGRVASFFIDEQNIVQYMCGKLNAYELGVKFAKRHNLSGAENLFSQQFERLMAAERYSDAVNLAIASPQGILRTMETINKLKALPTNPGETSWVLQYFQTLLKKGKLNAVESAELVRPIVAKGSPQGLEHIQGWLKEQKLECSEELGDLLKSQNATLALSVYLRSNCPAKVVTCFCLMGAQEGSEDKAKEHFNNILAYSKRVNYTPDYPGLITNLQRVNPDRAKDLALMLMEQEGSLVDITLLVGSFMANNDVKNTTNILLEYLKPRGDREEDGDLQTKLLEINLLSMPQVADAIMESDDYEFTHYNKAKIAMLCERANLYQRALEHYTNLDDIKRCLTNTHMINPDFMLEFFGRMDPSNCLECLNGMLKYNLQQNIRLVVEIAKKWREYISEVKLIELFESFQSWNGIFFFLGSFINTSQDPAIVFKYITAACKLNQLKEVERICKDHDYYDPLELKDFLLRENMKDPRPLIYVCDRHNFVNELTQHLYANNMYMFIEAYVSRMNPKAAPMVVGGLIDLNASDEQIKKLMETVRNPLDDDQFFTNLVDECEKRNRLKILRPWMEKVKEEGNETPSLHSGLAKIYVDINFQPAQFLNKNQFYDSKVVGAFCESRDPHLAFLAYKRAQGSCDQELIECCHKNGFYKDEARYCVERQDLALWAQVLHEDNGEHKRAVIDQVVSTALPESRIPDEVSTTVKAFMAANLPHELMELLERIILHGPSDGEFRTNKNLQNLLILTAIKADKARVMGYINRLDNYDGADIAKIAMSAQYELFEEAFTIYKKFEMGAEAIAVLLHQLHAIDRAVEFAKLWNKKDTWFILAKAQLDEGLVSDAIDSYLKSDNAEHYLDVIVAAKEKECFQELIPFLQMARTHVKNVVLDNELLFAFAFTGRHQDLEEFLHVPSLAKPQDVADLCFCKALYEAARIMYTHVGNFAKLALCLVKMELFTEAVAAATKANSVPTWKAVCFSCVDKQKFALAAKCGVNVIVYMDHLLDVLRHYEMNGYFEEVIALMEQGINLDRAHQGMFSHLGILYSKYKEQKLMEHIKLHWSRLNIPSLLSSCKEYLHWSECVFLYSHYDQFENAVDVMMEHSAESWVHELFKETIKQVANTEIFYRALVFYINEHPTQLVDLCMDLSMKLDHARVVSIIRSKNHLAMIQPYLLHVQRIDLIPVNEAVNELYLAEENHKALRESVTQYTNFDIIALAQSLEDHPLLQFRRLAAHLYSKKERYERAIEIAKADSCWQDAMDYTFAAQDEALTEELLMFFVEKKEYECFTAMLYNCYEMIVPDVILELSWRKNLMAYTMPYFINVFRQYRSRIASLEDRFAKMDAVLEADAAAKKAFEKQQANTDASYIGHVVGPYNPMMAPLALAAPPSYGSTPQFNPHMQQQFNPSDMGGGMSGGMGGGMNGMGGMY